MVFFETGRSSSQGKDSRTALKSHLSGQLDCIIEIVNNHKMRAMRLVPIERGYDQGDFTMLAFGDAGPMHATFLADGLSIRDIIAPPGSGVFFCPRVLYWQTFGMIS